MLYPIKLLIAFELRLTLTHVLKIYHDLDHLMCSMNVLLKMFVCFRLFVLMSHYKIKINETMFF